MFYGEEEEVIEDQLRGLVTPPACTLQSGLSCVGLCPLEWQCVL